jgi:hypothetical protein
MEKRKKAAAAAAAVIEYITSEEAAMEIEAIGARAMTPAVAAGPVKLWGVSGRQDQMRMRNLMQIRTFR